MSFKIVDADKGLKNLIKRVFAMKHASIHVGILGEKGNQYHEGGSGQTVLDVATIHEYGLGHVPRRSFLADYFAANASRHREMIRVMLETVVKGKRSPEVALEALGLFWVGEIQKRIAARIPPPLAEATIRQKTRAGKRGDVPLINTGQMRASISHRVYIK